MIYASIQFSSKKRKRIEVKTICVDCCKELKILDIDIKYSPTEHLVNTPLIYCEKPNMKITLIIIGILVVLFVCIYAYYGGFKKIEFGIQKQGGETIVYESLIGDYNQTSKYTDKVYFALLNDDKIETTKGIGIFYDNPQTTDKDKLRSDVGCVLDNPDSTTITKLSEKYQLQTLPSGDFIVTEFPMNGGLSFMLGIIKVYPSLNKYCIEHGYKDSPITEIYDVPNKKIIYRKRIVK